MSWKEILKVEKGLDEWFGNKAKGEEGETVSGWVSCQSCEDDKKGVKPCGRDSADKGKKQRCRKNCAACKTYKRRKGKSRRRSAFTR